MRLAALSVLATATIFTAGPSHAQTYDPLWPVCMKVYSGSSGGGGEWNDCRYTSIPQCQAMAMGRAATCVINPYGSVAQGPAPAPGKVYRRAPRAYQ